jgi:hypothetical protein
VIKVYSEDETSRALEVPSDITARGVCQLLIVRNHYVDDHSWTLFEHLPHVGVGKDAESQSPIVSLSLVVEIIWQRLSYMHKIEQKGVKKSPFLALFIFSHWYLTKKEPKMGKR